MKLEHIAALFVMTFALAAHAEDLRVGSAAVLYETGLVAPVVDLRSIDKAGRVWRASVSGWTITAARELPVQRGRRLIFTVDVTPFGAHSSRRMYHDGVRDRALEFGDASFDFRAGMRIRQSEHAAIEPSVIIGKEIVGTNAPLALRDRWRSPFAGVAVTQRLRFVTADDPLRGRLDGVEVVATGEIYGAKRTWSRVMLTENGGLSLGRIHVRESVAAFHGNGIDDVTAFLIGGSWDVLGATAVYGRRYAEFRLARGVVASGGADVDAGSLTVGVRASRLHAPSHNATGLMLLVGEHIAGVRVTAGAGRSGGRTNVMASIGGALFR